MRFSSLVGIEAKKIRRSGIVPILAAAAVILWLPSLFNAGMSFQMQAEGILPEYNFFIQGLLAMAWFMFPASMVVSTVLITQTERGGNGMLKMLALPLSMAKLCLAKFVVLLALAAVQMLFTVGMYYASAAIASHMQGYNFVLPLGFVLEKAALFVLAAVPMLAVFWLLAVGIQTPIFSLGIGLILIIPSVLVINTKAWFAYPMAYPFFVMTAEYGKLAAHVDTLPVALVPWLPVALGIALVCLLISCLRFGQAERR